jgi:hypothetical protein
MMQFTSSKGAYISFVSAAANLSIHVIALLNGLALLREDLIVGRHFDGYSD